MPCGASYRPPPSFAPRGSVWPSKRLRGGPERSNHGTVGQGDTPRDISRLIVPEAARQLGISPEAVRNRLSRGTLKSVKEGGTV
jgi:hypothetical protein